MLLSSVTFYHGKFPSLTGCLAHCTSRKAVRDLLATCFSQDKQPCSPATFPMSVPSAWLPPPKLLSSGRHTASIWLRCQLQEAFPDVSCFLPLP